MFPFSFGARGKKCFKCTRHLRLSQCVMFVQLRPLWGKYREYFKRRQVLEFLFDQNDFWIKFISLQLWHTVLVLSSAVTKLVEQAYCQYQAKCTLVEYVDLTTLWITTCGHKVYIEKPLVWSEKLVLPKS